MKYLLEMEKENLEKLQVIENITLKIASNALVNDIKNSFNTQEINHDYVLAYEKAMLIAWLLGSYHIIQSLDKIELSQVQPIAFNEAIKFLKTQVPVTNEEYKNLEANLKLKAYTIAHVSRVDYINQTKKIYIDALENGFTKQKVMQNMDKYFDKIGISQSNPYHLELHFRNNIMSAYNAGRYRQIQDENLIEYLVYNSVLDDGTTKLCKELYGVIKPKNSDFWDTYHPLNHHKCRAIVSPMTKAQYQKTSQTKKQKSQKTTDQNLKKDEQIIKEHQFKSSPTTTMGALPNEIMSRALEYDLTEKITKQSFDESSDVINARVAKSKPYAIDFLEEINAVYFGLGRMNQDNFEAKIYYLKQNKDTSEILAIPAFNKVDNNLFYKKISNIDAEKLLENLIEIK